LQIGIVSDYYYPQLGGITEQAHGQASELARRGHDVTLITPNLLVTPKTIDSGEPPSEPLFEILKVGRAYPFYVNGSETLLSISPRLVADLDRIYADRRFDVVHVHNPFGPALPIAGVMRSRAPVTVGTIHSVFPEGFKLLRVFSRPLRRIFRRLDARIAVSAAVVDSIRGHLPDLSFEVIPNGIDTGFFSPAASPLPHLLDDKRNILFVGRFDPRNGLPHMLKAFALLRQRRDDVRLIILGDGPLRRVYQRLVPSELREDVRFEGRVNRLRPRYLASADLLCTPCQLASFGLVVLEAMSAGLPVVASSISGFRLLMQHGVQGLLVENATDGAGFADALDRLLDDRELARRMGAAGRERALTVYGWPIVADRLEDLYERLLHRQTGRRLGPVAAR